MVEKSNMGCEDLEGWFMSRGNIVVGKWSMMREDLYEKGEKILVKALMMVRNQPSKKKKQRINYDKS